MGRMGRHFGASAGSLQDVEVGPQDSHAICDVPNIYPLRPLTFKGPHLSRPFCKKRQLDDCLLCGLWSQCFGYFFLCVRSEVLMQP